MSMDWVLIACMATLMLIVMITCWPALRLRLPRLRLRAPRLRTLALPRPRKHPPPCERFHLNELHLPPQLRGQLPIAADRYREPGGCGRRFGPGEERWAEAYENMLDALTRRAPADTAGDPGKPDGSPGSE